MYVDMETRNVETSNHNILIWLALRPFIHFVYLYSILKLIYNTKYQQQWCRGRTNVSRSNILFQNNLFLI